MGQVLKLKFQDFKSLANDRRIYYYDTPEYVDLYFLFEGFIIKTTVYREQIESIDRFFSDKIFYGAMRLDFKIPDTDFSSVEMVLGRESPLMTNLDEVQDEENALQVPLCLCK